MGDLGRGCFQMGSYGLACSVIENPPGTGSSMENVRDVFLEL